MPPIKNSNISKTVWNEYTESLKTVDFSGKPICKQSYSDENSKYGWDIDHIVPKETKIPNVNSVKNLQPINIDTNRQKGSNISGLIEHEYDDRFVWTEYEIDKKDKFIYIKKQIINYKNKDKNINYIVIEDVYFKNEYCLYYENNNERYSYIDVNDSLENKCLVFVYGQDPTKWPKTKK